MQTETGDDYVRRIANFIRANETRLAGPPGRAARAQQQQSAGFFDALGLGAKPEESLIFSTDLHHLYYLLLRFQELELDVGPMDIRLDNVSRPLSYASMIAAKDQSDTGSILSFKSLSGVSNLSLTSGWWPRAAPGNIQTELKTIFSAFTKIPSISISQGTLSVISELANDPPIDNVVPLHVFKNIKSLELVDIDPRLIMGWDRLSISLRSLVIRKSGVEDFTEVFIDAVAEDQARRNGDLIRPKQRRMSHKSSGSRHPSWKGRPIAPPLAEDEEENEQETKQTSPFQWAFLVHLSLADNGLTFFPPNIVSHLLTIRHLDLSSNLLVSVPPEFKQLYNLVSLNLSNNMIESVLGIYTMLGQVLKLNLSKNRIDSLCGLERLVALERIDVRHNQIVDIHEVGRLATLPNISQIWIEGNDFVHINVDYRVTVFNQFLKEGKSILMDGTGPSFMERRNLIRPPPVPHLPIPTPSAHSPPVVAVGVSLPLPSSATQDSFHLASSALPTSTPRKRKPKRVVDLDAADEDITRGRTGREKDIQPKPIPHALSTSPHEFSSSPPNFTPKSPTKGRHTRTMTTLEDGASPPISPRVRSPTMGSATISGNGSSKKRTKINVAMYDTPRDGSLEPGLPSSQKSGGAEAFKAEIEALRASAPDNWLKVLSQKQYAQDDADSITGSNSGGGETKKRRRHLRGVTEF